MTATATSNVSSLPTRRAQPNNGYTEFSNPYELCAYMRHEIAASKMRYKVIASKANLCQATVSRLASGETKDPHIRTVITILFALGIRLYAK